MDSDEGDCNTNINIIYRIEAYLRNFTVNIRWRAFLCLNKVLIWHLITWIFNNVYKVK